jgi:hypothetical protein
MMKVKTFQVLYQIINRESISINIVVFRSVILKKTTINIVKYYSKFHCTEKRRQWKSIENQSRYFAQHRLPSLSIIYSFVSLNLTISWHFGTEGSLIIRQCYFINSSSNPHMQKEGGHINHQKVYKF